MFLDMVSAAVRLSFAAGPERNPMDGKKKKNPEENTSHLIALHCRPEVLSPLRIDIVLSTTTSPFHLLYLQLSLAFFYVLRAVDSNCLLPHTTQLVSEQISTTKIFDLGRARGLSAFSFYQRNTDRIISTDPFLPNLLRWNLVLNGLHQISSHSALIQAE